MGTKGIMLAACALLTTGACAHDHQRERATASALTNSDVSANEAPEKRRMHYTEVSDEHALGRDKEGVNSTMEEGNGMPRAQTVTVPACGLEVYFPTDSASLDARSQHSLDTVAECIKRHEVDHATIVGSADPRGTKEHNDQLSLERARVVAEYLRGRGVAEGDIRVRSKGAVAQSDSQLWPRERAANVQVTR